MTHESLNTAELPLHRLRRVTQDAHQAVERTIDWPAAFSSTSKYLDLLLAYRNIIESADDAVSKFLTDVETHPYHFEPRLRTQWLEKDRHVVLDELPSGRLSVGWPQVVFDTCEQRKFAVCRFDCVQTMAAAIGVQYVLEGSSLGGQILSRQLKNALGFTSHHGGCFFAGYGDETSARWKNFCFWANRQLVDDVQQAEEAALHTFGCFVSCFAELSDE